MNLKKISLVIIPFIIGYFCVVLYFYINGLKKQVKSYQDAYPTPIKIVEENFYNAGFKDGIVFAIKKYNDDKLLKISPDNPINQNLIDCLFVNIDNGDEDNKNWLPSFKGNGQVIVSSTFIQKLDYKIPLPFKEERYSRFFKNYLESEKDKGKHLILIENKNGVVNIKYKDEIFNCFKGEKMELRFGIFNDVFTLTGTTIVEN